MTIYEYLNISPEQYTFKRDYIENPLKKNVIRKKGGLEYEQPYLEDVKYLYLTLNKSAKEMNDIFGYKISDKLGKWCNKRDYMKTPKLSKEEMIELYCNQHKSLRELADMFGYVGTTPIEDWLKIYHIPQLSDRYIKNKLDEETLRKLYIDDNLSSLSISQMFNTTKKTILNLLQTFNMKKDEDMVKISIFKSNHNELQNRVLLDKNEFEKFIIENDIVCKEDLCDKLSLGICTINKYLREFGLKKYFNKRNNSLECKWLDFIGLPRGDEYRQVRIDNYIVDGYDPKTNTIYEYLGDYWHGNPKTFNQNDMNKTIGKTFGELYESTMNRMQKLKDMGYAVKYVWESDINPR